MFVDSLFSCNMLFDARSYCSARFSNINNTALLTCNLDSSLNGYKTAFVDKVCARNTNALNCDGEADKQRGFTCIPYIKGLAEKVKHILTRYGIRTAFKPVRTLANVFKKPKDMLEETRKKAIVYKFKCKSCAFTYIGQTKRCWCSRWLEHKPGVRRKITSAIKDLQKARDMM